MSLYQRAERVERRSGAIDDLTIHVFPNFVHRNMSRTFDNHLNVVLPSDFRQFAEHFQFAELRLVVCVGNAARRKPSPSEKAMSYFLSNSQISSK